MIANGIDTKDISVVVQGAVDVKLTKKCLESIRKYLPDAEIILSTWENSKLDNLDYDKVVESKDPGAYPCDIVLDSTPNNVDRQIVSTQGGLKHANRKYCIKIRTDFFLESSDFLNYFGKYECYDDTYHFFTSRIICCSIYSRNPRVQNWPLAMAFCPSDFFFFGFTEDLKKLFFNVDLSSEEDKVYFDVHEDEVKELKYKNALCRYMPEQYIWISFISKYLENINCRHRDDVNKVNIVLTEKTFANNIIILDLKQIGINSDKKDIFTKGIPQNCFTHKEWKRIYYAYAKKNNFYIVKIIISSWFERLKKQNYVEELDTHSVEKIGSLKEVESYIRDYKIVSFDLFDTLIYRIPSPSWVPTSQLGLNMSLILKNYNYDYSPELINRLRDEIVAEEYANNKKAGFDAEYKFDELIEKLLNYIGIESGKIEEIQKKIIENEIHREKNAIYLNKDAIDILENLKRKYGKKLVLISDMYLSKKEIELILKSTPMWDLFDHIYISSEIGYTKASGKLYDYVLDDLNASPNEIIHVGDNLYSDILSARKKNIKSLMFYDRKEKERNINSANAILSNNSFERYASELSFSKENLSFEEYIKSMLGYDIWNFTYKLAIDARLNGIEALFFLERDGNLFKSIFDILSENVTVLNGSKEIRTLLLKLSRTDSACLSDISSAYSVINRAKSINPPRCFKISHVIGCYGLNYEDFTEEEKVLLKKYNYNKDFFCQHYFEIFQPKIIQRRNQILSYLEEQNIFQYKKIGFVDIGWGGTIQKDFLELIKREKIDLGCYGYYYACDNRIEELPNSSYFFYRNASTLWYGYSLLEFLVKEYTPLNAELNSSDEMYETYKLNQKSRKAILECKETYLKLIDNYFLTVINIMNYCSPLIQKMITNPDIDFVKMVEGVQFSLDRRKNDEFLFLVEKVKTRKELDDQLVKAQWVQGSKKISGFISISETGNLKKIMNKIPLVRKTLWWGLNIFENNIYKYRKG